MWALLHFHPHFNTSFWQMEGRLSLSTMLIMGAATTPRALTNGLPLRCEISTAQDPPAKLLRGTVGHTLLTLILDWKLWKLDSILTSLPFKCFQASIHSFHSASTAAMGNTTVLSMQATQCLETPVLALTSTWRWLTYVSVSSSKPT